MNFAIPVKMSPTPLSRRQAVSPTRPPGLHTRGKLGGDTRVVGGEDDTDR
jgi:hypothetical protein